MGEIMSEEISQPEPVAEEVPQQDSPPAQKEASPPPPDTRRVKIDGEYHDVSIADLEKAYGLEKSSRKKFEEASSLRKEVDGFLDTLSKGELAELKKFVPEDKLLSFAESLIKEKVEWEETPQEKRERILAERERDEYKQKYEELTKKDKEQQFNKMNDEVANEIDEEISEVISQLEGSYGNIVKSPEFVQDVARIMLAQLSKGTDNVNTKKAADMALKGWKRKLGTYVNNISPDDLTKVLSKQQIELLRKAKVEEALDQMNRRPQKKQRVRKKQSSKVSVDNFFDSLERKISKRG